MLNPREQRLLTIVLLILGGYLLYAAVQWLALQPLRERNEQLAALQNTIRRKKLQRRQVLQQQEQLQQWQQLSLPSDPRKAQSIYHEFLLRLVNEVGLEDPAVNTMPPAPQGSTLVRYPFTVRGRGSLETVVRLLRYFYSVDVLHQIRQLSLRRRDDGELLDVELRVEAISLNDGSEGGVAEIEPREGGEGSIGNPLPEELLTGIVSRNIFAPYRPPRTEPEQPTEPEEPAVDPRQFVYLVGCVAIGPECEAWLYDRLANQTYRLRAGDTLDVAGVQGRVIMVAEEGVTFESGGRRYRILLGENLANMRPVEDAQAGQNRAGAESARLLPVAASDDN